MGRAGHKKKKKKSREPYSRHGGDAAMDVEGGSAGAAPETLGRMKQRHHHENKELKKEIADLKRQKIRLKKERLEDRQSKKSITEEIKQMRRALEDKHQAELSALIQGRDVAAASDAAVAKDGKFLVDDSGRPLVRGGAHDADDVAPADVDMAAMPPVPVFDAARLKFG